MDNIMFYIFSLAVLFFLYEIAYQLRRIADDINYKQSAYAKGYSDGKKDAKKGADNE